MANGSKETLPQSENLLSSLVNSVNAILWEADATTFQFSFVNQQAERILGYPVEQWVSEPSFWTNHTHPDDVDWCTRFCLETTAEHRDHEFEYRMIAADGRVVWLRDIVSVKTGADGSARLHGIMIDITGRKLVEQALDERLRFETLLAELSAAFAKLPPAEVDRGIDEWLRRLVEFLGVDRGTFFYFLESGVLSKGHSYSAPGIAPLPLTVIDQQYPWLTEQLRRGNAVAWSRIPDDIPEEAVEERQYALEVGAKSGVNISVTIGRSLVCAIAFTSMRGYREWSDEVVARLRLVGEVFANAVARKNAEEALRASEARFHAAFSAMPMPCGIATLETGEFVDVNEAFAATFGHARENIIGRTSLDIGLWRDESERQRFTAEIGAAGRLRNYEATMRTRTGARRTILMSAEIVAVDGVPCILSAGNDITDSKRMEDELRQAQRMETVGRLAGGVAHDFNNLLTIISGYSHRVLMQLNKNDPLRRDVDQIRTAGERAAALTRQLLAFSRRQLLQPKVININAIVSDISTMFSRLIGDDVEFVERLDPQLGNANADPGQIEQVIVNLVVNARDAMPGGGRLTLETANAELDETSARSYADVLAGRFVMLAISDTGVGMTEEVKQHVFEPFFTTKGPGEGSGLGLATVYGIVKQSGGFIFLYSEVDRGTTFKVYLPRVDAEEDVCGGPQTTEPGALVCGHGTVLVAEDEAGVLELVVETLEQAGYSVLAARHGGEAILQCDAYDGDIDLMITDVVMPVMDGRALAERISHKRPKMRVIFTSGHTEDRMLRQSVLGDGVDFLAKPFTPAELTRKVREVLDRP